MPLYEYECKQCGRVFEKLVLRFTSQKPHCPHCESAQTEQVYSAFNSVGGTRSGSNLSPKSCGNPRFT
ncbi:MAG: zinc ribbon domain-containing protein [Acidobacteriia bacterium]|nr:zinc ribbon domain-containing protein [Terriglobia bacterium]